MTTPTLNDDRIESMRSTVMSTVNADIARRGTRTRRVIGLAAASVLVAGVGAIGVNQFGGGNSSSDLATSTPGKSAAPKSSASSQLGLPQLGDPGTRESAPTTDLSAPTGAKVIGRQVITTGTINATVKDPRTTAQQLSAYVDSIGGRIDTRTETGHGDTASAFLQVRVPSTKVTDTIAKLKAYGTVNEVSLQHDDVTTQAQDLDARIHALGISIGRLEAILAKASTSAAVVSAESALTERQAQLEQLQSEKKAIADQVQLSTLAIDLTQKTKADSVTSSGFRGGLLRGWNQLVSAVNHVVEGVGVILPWAVVAAVIYGAYRLVTRRRPAS